MGNGESGLQICYVVSLSNYSHFSTSRKIVVPSSSGSRSFLGLLEDKSTTSLWKFSNSSPSNTSYHFGRAESLAIPLWELKYRAGGYYPEMGMFLINIPFLNSFYPDLCLGLEEVMAVNEEARSKTLHS